MLSQLSKTFNKIINTIKFVPDHPVIFKNVNTTNKEVKKSSNLV